MATIRKPYQGVLNIVRFNWPFYVFASLLILIIFFIRISMPQPSWLTAANSALVIFILTTLATLIVSFYVYDVSGIYALNWLNIPISSNGTLLHVHAGFDEFTEVIHTRFPGNKITVCDFYDEKKHTEASIKRARAMYPPASNIIKVNTYKLPFDDAAFEGIILFFAAHEIRNENERIQFFTEISRVAKPDGKILVMEHLRNLPNFMAYNIGFLHFFSNKNWMNCFAQAGLNVVAKANKTSFVTIYTLTPNGNSN